MVRGGALLWYCGNRDSFKKSLPRRWYLLLWYSSCFRFVFDMVIWYVLMYFIYHSKKCSASKMEINTIYGNS